MANKAYAIILSEKAETEIITSWSWYEERQKGLGDKFLNTLNSKIELIASNPELYAEKHKQYREAILRIFPVLIIYKIHKKGRLIRILSVFHTARNPNRKY